MLPGIFYYLRAAKTFYMTVPLMFSFDVCHIYSKKRRGAFLIFVSPVRRLFKRLLSQRQNILVVQFNLQVIHCEEDKRAEAKGYDTNAIGVYVTD